MRILELILHRYTRLSFSAIETIHYKPSENVQIIIGTNGSGKSSLLNELNPLPPNKNYMLDGGFKTIRIEHMGTEYTLHSSYGKHRKNSFIEHHPEKGDIELNDGGTGVAQKILIEKVFGLDMDLLRIWLGRVKFTELAPIKRRDWILKLSGSDLDYAMRVFNMVKHETRDAQALEKHFIKRLAEESADMADQNRIEELENSVVRITSELNKLLEHRDNSVPTVASVQFDIDQLVKEFEICSQQAMGERIVKPSFLPDDVNDVQGLKVYISNQNTRVELLRQKLNEYYEQKQTINNALETLSNNGVQSTAELKSVTELLRTEIDAMIATTPIYKEVQDADVAQLMGRYQGCKSLLIETLSILPDNSEGYFTRERLAKAREALISLDNRMGAAKRRVIELQHSLEHFKDIHDVNCPKCDFQFKPGFQNFDPAEIEKEIQAINEKIASDKERHDKGVEYCENASEYIRQVNGLRRILADNPELEPLWKMLIEEGLYKAHPQSHLPTIASFQPQLENCLQIRNLQEQVRVNETVLQSVSNATSGSGAYSDSYLEQIDLQIAATISEIDNASGTIKSAQYYLRQVERSNNAVLRALEIRDTLAKKYEVLVKSGVNRALSEVIQSKQLLLANVNTSLNKITRHDAVVQEITGQKEKASDNLAHYMVIQKAISPVDGLISKYIQSFLDVFIEDINIVISEIWTSDLEVLSCGVDSSDVTCKFPLSVNAGYLVTPDISEASDGQMDIINFAFRMVIAQYLNLQDYPLYLDELAPTLDEQHRENLTRYVNNLMESNQFEQMFMISHYASNHYAFANSEILMMDGRNIINKPGQFNTHVKISYSNELAAQAKAA